MPHFMDNDLPSTFGLIKHVTNTVTLPTAIGTFTTPIITFTVPLNPNGSAANEFDFLFRVPAYAQLLTTGTQTTGNYTVQYTATFTAPEFVSGYSTGLKSLNAFGTTMNVKTPGNFNRGDIAFSAKASTQSSPSVVTINRVVSVSGTVPSVAAVIKEDIALEGI